MALGSSTKTQTKDFLSTQDQSSAAEERASEMETSALVDHRKGNP